MGDENKVDFLIENSLYKDVTLVEESNITEKEQLIKRIVTDFSKEKNVSKGYILNKLIKIAEQGEQSEEDWKKQYYKELVEKFKEYQKTLEQENER